MRKDRQVRGEAAAGGLSEDERAELARLRGENAELATERDVQSLLARGKCSGTTAIVLSDGTLRVAGDIYETPSRAGKAVLGRTVNGWSFCSSMKTTERVCAIFEPNSD